MASAGMYSIDLTLTLNNSMPGVAISVAKTLASDGWNASTLNLYSHCGTHMDAPVHFGVTDQTIDQLPLSRFISKAWKVHIPVETDHYLITLSDLTPIMGHVKSGDSLVLHTAWSRFVNSPRYRNGLPRVSEAVAQWCVEQKINILGVEPPSVADVHNIDEVTEIHRILLGGGVTIIEGLTNLEALPDAPFTLIALPLKVKDGDGAPARVMALPLLADEQNCNERISDNL